MATFTCPQCGTHEFKSISGDLGMCAGSTPYVYPVGAPRDVPVVLVACPFVWPRKDDALYFKKDGQ